MRVTCQAFSHTTGRHASGFVSSVAKHARYTSDFGTDPIFSLYIASDSLVASFSQVARTPPWGWLLEAGGWP